MKNLQAKSLRAGERFQHAKESVRELVKRTLLRSARMRRLCTALCVHDGALPNILIRTPSARLREMLFLPSHDQTSQLNQDVFALLVARFKSGYFVEIGANDGFTLSNTAYLEEKFAWDGLLIEANPQYQQSLLRRRAKSVIAAVTAEEGEYEFCAAGLYGGLTHSLDGVHRRHTAGAASIIVNGRTLEQLLVMHQAPAQIDFISIDVEGGEIPIVEQLCCLRDFRFSCGCIEHNGRRDDCARITALLRDAGYEIVWAGQTSHDLFFVDKTVLNGQRPNLSSQF